MVTHMKQHNLDVDVLGYIGKPKQQMLEILLLPSYSPENVKMLIFLEKNIMQCNVNV